MTLRRTEEWLADRVRRLREAARPTQAQKTEIADRWNGQTMADTCGLGNIEPVTLKAGAAIGNDAVGDTPHGARRVKEDAVIPPAPKRLVAPERDVLAAVLELVKRHPRIAFAKRINSGATKYRDEHGNVRWVAFGFKGCSDVLGMLRGGRLLAIEVKRKGERPTDDQQAFIEAVNGGGGLAFVAYGVDDVMRELEAA